MALIICPECGYEVSDKAEICPHCGIKIAGNPDIAARASNIGQGIQQPIQQAAQQAVRQPVSPTPTAAPVTPQPNIEPTTTYQKNKGGKSKGVLIVSFLIALAVVGTTYYFYASSQAEKEQEDYEYAMQNDDPMVLQMYLSRYADAPHEHRDSVNARLTLLSQKDTEWSNAVTSGTKSALEEYLRNNPNSPHKGEASNKIDSIDYAIASRGNSVESYTKYLQQHPDGRYAGQAQDFIDSKKDTEVSPEETTIAKTVFKHFFQAINSRNESRLLATVSEQLTNFLNKANASEDDVVTYMNKLYKDDVKNLNWHILDDFKINKVKDADATYSLKVEFPAELRYDRTDPNKEKYAKFIISGEISSEGKISRLTMKRLAD